jgi:hypothetical protein
MEKRLKHKNFRLKGMKGRNLLESVGVDRRILK